MILSVEALLKQVGKDPLPPTLLIGPGKLPRRTEYSFEPYLAETAVKRVVETYVDPSLQDLAYSSLYAEETTPGAVAEEARTLPFLAERRVILVRNADVYMAMGSDKRSPVQPLLQFIESPVDTTLLILLCSSINKQRALYKACAQHGAVVECPQLEGREYTAWICAQFKDAGRSISREAVSLLIDRAGDKMSDMSNAINLVCNFADAGQDITDADVLAATADVAETTIWALTDAIAASNPTAALEALHDLLGLNKSPDEIIGTLNWLLESTYKAHPKTPLKLGKPFVERKVAPLARKFSTARLAAALGMCTKTHFALRTTGTDTQLALELLIIKLAKAKK